jgi:hypothetical protein
MNNLFSLQFSSSKICITSICAGVAFSLLSGCDFKLPSPPPATLYKYNVIPVGIGPAFLVAEDFNQDGFQDIVSANAKNSTLTLLLGKGDGTFASNIDIAMPAEPTTLAVGHFNNDTYPDLAVNSRGENSFTILFGSPKGLRIKHTHTKTGKVPLGIIVADYNQDGIKDVAVTLTFDKMEIFIGTGNGNFKLGERYITGSRAFSGVSYDFNGDGKMDIALAASSSTASAVKIFPGNGDGTFAHPLSIAKDKMPLAIALHDMNADGRMDLIYSSAKGDNMFISYSRGDGTFEDEIAFSGGGGPLNFTVGNFNDDALPDVAVANSRASSFSVVVRRPNGSFIYPTRDYVVDGGTVLAITDADFNKDGLTDIAVASNFKNTIEIYLQRRLLK